MAEVEPDVVGALVSSGFELEVVVAGSVLTAGVVCGSFAAGAGLNEVAPALLAA